MAENPEECRRRALECASLALTTSDPAAREFFTSFAEKWLALAIDGEEPQALLEEWGVFVGGAPKHPYEARRAAQRSGCGGLPRLGDLRRHSEFL